VLATIPAGFRPIVVDNGSVDATADVAGGLGATVVDEPARGFGSACFAGLLAATADVVCFMDCDGSLHGSDLMRVAEPVSAGETDLVLGSRRAERGAWPPHARLGNRIVAWQLGRRLGLTVRDVGPMRAARRTALLDLGMTDRRFGWPLEMVVRAHRAGWRIREVEVPYAPRVGRSKVTGTVRGTVRTVRDMRAALR